MCGQFLLKVEGNPPVQDQLGPHLAEGCWLPCGLGTSLLSPLLPLREKLCQMGPWECVWSRRGQIGTRAKGPGIDTFS